MKRIFEYGAIFSLIITLAILTGCSGEKQETGTATTGESQGGITEPVTLKDSIEYSLNVTLDRLRYGDKSGLYENEFEYMFPVEVFDDYLEYRHVKFAKADTIKWVEVTRVTPYDRDSADLKVVVHFEGPAGIETEFDDRITVHYRRGQWIKPTASNLKGQLEWEKSKK